MLYGEIIALCAVTHAQHRNVRWCTVHSILMLTHVVHKVISRLYTLIKQYQIKIQTVKHGRVIMRTELE